MSPVRLQNRLIRALGRRRAMFVALGCVAASGCFKPDDGREPPLDRIYFPTGIALSPDGNRLYVANSDWDLQFNAGSVQVYDAARLRALLPTYCESDAECSATGGRCDASPSTDASGIDRAPTHWCLAPGSDDPCAGLGQQTAAQRTTAPGLCAPIDNRSPDLLLDSVNVGAFATDLLYRANQAGSGGRLFVPVRSDATLHWMDVAGDAPGSGPEIDCGQGASGECDDRHRRGDSRSEETPAGEELPIEPFGIDASEDGRAIVVSHQTEGRVSLFVNDWEDADTGPSLSYVLEGLPSRPVLVSAIPVPEVARLDRLNSTRALGYRPGFWVGFRGTPFVQLVRYFDAVDAPDGLPFLETAFADRVNTTAVSDIRGIAVDASARKACEAGCGGERGCLEQCSGVSLDVYLSNTVPASLLIGHSTSIRRASVPNDRLEVSDAVAIDPGPSRTVVGDVIDERGERQRRVFVTSFDARSVSIYDPAAQAVERRVLTGRGPTALAIDPQNAIAYVAHFTDSYVGIIDLDRRHATYGTMVRAVGRPTAPRGDE
jgi:DNA-binding beta-propeller fold protein YncE